MDLWKRALSGLEKTKWRIGVLFIAFVLGLLGTNAQAAILFDGRFESGVIDNSGDLGPDRFWYGALGPNCKQSTTYSTNNDNKLVSAPTRGSWSTKAASLTVRYNCDYRPFNGGTATGLQKPRQELGVPESLFKLDTNVVYKIAFSVMVPSDYKVDHDAQDWQMFETFKLNNRNSTATGTAQTNGGGAFYLNVVGDELQWLTNNPHTGSTLNYDFPSREERFPLNPGTWHDFLIDTRLCNVGQAGCSGYVKLYKDGVLIREWTGANTTSTAGHKIKWGLYKPSWHCTIPGPGYSKYPPTNAQSDYAFCMTNPHATLVTTPVTTYVDEIKVGDSSSTYAELQPWRFDGGFTPDPEAPRSIIRVNQDLPIPNNKPATINDQPVYFTTDGTVGTGTGTKGVVDVELTDGTTTLKAQTFNSDSSGGRFNVGLLDSLNTLTPTLKVYYDEDNLILDTEGTQSIDTWNPDGMSATPLTPTPTANDLLVNYGFKKPYMLANESAAYKSVNTPTMTALPDGTRLSLRCSFAEDGATTNRVRIRVAEKIGGTTIYNVVSGAYGSVALGAQAFGSGPLLNVQSDNGIHQVQYGITTTAASADYYFSIGADSNVLGASIKVLGCKLWKDPSPLVMNYTVTLDRPDVTSPIPGPCELNKVGHSAAVSCTLDDNTGNVCVSIRDSNTTPTVADVKSGTGAIWNNCGAPTGYNYGVTSPLLDIYKDWYLYVVHTDSSLNDSVVISGEEYVPAETLVTKKLKLGSVSSRIQRGGVNGNFVYSKVTVYSENILVNPDASPLVILENVTVADGLSEAVEEDVTFGSLNALEPGTYWVLSSRPALSGVGYSMSYGQRLLVAE